MARRAVVIGAGHHGLVAALRLAERGHDVLVLESAGKPGGAVRSDELTLPGFVHDTCSGYFPLTAASPAFADLELDVDWINPPMAMAHVLDQEGHDIALHRDLSATAASLDACKPGAGVAWRELMNTLLPHTGPLVGAGLGRLPPMRSSVSLLARLRTKALELAPLAVASSSAIGRRLFGDERAAAWLAASGTHADLSPLAAGSGAFALGLNFLAHAVGWPFPRGGAGKLTDALVSRICDHGGEIRCGAAVAAIDTTGRRVAGVRTDAGERIAADAVICTVSPGPLAHMIAPGVLPGRVERRLHGWRYGLGTLKLDYALSDPVPWRASDARRAAVVHIGGPLSDIISSLEQASRGEFPERPSLVVGQHSVHDASRAPQGRHTLYAYARVPQQTGMTDAEMAERVEQRIEQFAPGFRELILGRSVRSPATIEAENPSLRGGDLASGSCELDQQLVFRPAPELCRGRTPVRGLYVAGGWVHPGPGVHGSSGRAAADALLADVRWRRA